MIRINGFLHRSALYDLIRRWMFNQPAPSDAGELLRLVHFNNVYVSRYLPLLGEGILSALHHCRLSSRRARTKGDLKDRVVQHLPYRTPRVTRLVSAYGRDPGLYFRETPFQGTLYFCAGDDGELYVGASRIKRVRRLAEKSARRLVGWIYGEIRQRAQRMDDGTHTRPEASLAVVAGGKGVPAAELRRAEAQFLAQIRENRPSRLPEDLEINDVAGIKLILEPEQQTQLLSVLQGLGCGVVELERHTGDYQATNLIVEYLPDKERILAQPLRSRIIGVFQDHGIAGEAANRAFQAFVRNGEAGIRVEIIVSDYLQMLESEIGRCMHEDRIIRQRQEQEYQGQLARNVEFLLEYLFTFPAAPHARLDGLPVRLWDRYLPDYFDEVRRALFHMPSVELNDL